ncbi:MAG: BatA domain-containing protein [Verrucomicrobiia bacterium]
MTFLEPIMLYGLPLALLPVIIHLLNKLRHRSVRWAAMMFLLSANRTATRQARIKQWLILLMRVFAVAALVFVVSRPLAGGWLGWVFQGAPDAILIVLDRSLSMETKINGATKRETAIQILANSARAYQGRSQLILIDTATRTPQEIGDPALLGRLSFTAASDTAADVIATLESGLEWIQRNKPGSTEIWIASDLQKSNWQPDNERWRDLLARLGSATSNLRVRLLQISNPSPIEDNSVLIKDAFLKNVPEGKLLTIELAVERTSSEQVNLPLNIFVNRTRQYIEIPCQGQSVSYRHKVLIEEGDKYASGWGKVEISADANVRNNIAYFVYSAPPVLKAAIISSNSIGGRILTIAAAPSKSDTNRMAELVPVEKADSLNIGDYALVVWNEKPPSGELAEKLRSYVRSGGVVLFFAGIDEGNFEGINFGKEDQTEQDRALKVASWQENEGVLARTEEGLSLPLNELRIFKRRQLSGGEALARFEDGSVFIARKVLGKGQIIACASSVEPDCSNLREGIVLVPLIQRLFESGAKRIRQSGMLVCGEADFRAIGESVVPVEGGSDYRANAGVYRVGGRLVAVNHPEVEDNFEIADSSEIRSVFNGVNFTLFEEKYSNRSSFQSEIWRSFLIAMVLFLIIESILVLPPRVRPQQQFVQRQENVLVEDPK